MEATLERCEESETWRMKIGVRSERLRRQSNATVKPTNFSSEGPKRPLADAAPREAWCHASDENATVLFLLVQAGLDAVSQILVLLDRVVQLAAES